MRIEAEIKNKFIFQINEINLKIYFNMGNDPGLVKTILLLKYFLTNKGLVYHCIIRIKYYNHDRLLFI